jgi:hypothetical protein
VQGFYLLAFQCVILFQNRIGDNVFLLLAACCCHLAA